MRFYTRQHRYYCRIDLHAGTMYVSALVVAVECIITWYWLADLCAKVGIPLSLRFFVAG